MLLELSNDGSDESEVDSPESSDNTVLLVGEQFRRTKRNMLAASTISILFAIADTGAYVSVPGVGGDLSGKALINTAAFSLMLSLYCGYIFWEFRHWSKVTLSLHSQQTKGGRLNDIYDAIDNASKFFNEQVDKLSKYPDIQDISAIIPYNYDTSRVSSDGELNIKLSRVINELESYRNIQLDEWKDIENLTSKLQMLKFEGRYSIANLKDALDDFNTRTNFHFNNFRTETAAAIKNEISKGQNMANDLKDINDTLSNLKSNFSKLYDGLTSSQKYMIQYHDTKIPSALFYIAIIALIIDVGSYRGPIIFVDDAECSLSSSQQPSENCISIWGRIKRQVSSGWTRA